MIAVAPSRTEPDPAMLMPLAVAAVRRLTSLLCDTDDTLRDTAIRFLWEACQPRRRSRRPSRDDLDSVCLRLDHEIMRAARERAESDGP